VSEVKQLVLDRGASVSFRVSLLDSKGDPEILGSLLKARVTILSELGGAVLLNRVLGTNLTVDGADLVCSVSPAETLALPAGVFVGQASVQFQSTGSWAMTDPFYVTVRDTGAEAY
jgi:hypothetical protein